MSHPHNIRPTKARPYWLAGQSQSSAHASAPGVSTSGLANLEAAIARTAIGGWVIDSRHLTWQQACNIISGPMPGLGLPKLTVSRLWQGQQAYASEAAFLAAVDAKEVGSLAEVSLDLYAAFWRRIGSKIGRVRRLGVVWEKQAEVNHV